MPLGKDVIEIGPENFVRGMSTSSFISDGGFAPNIGLTDTACNPQAIPGVLHGPSVETDGDGSNVLDNDEFVVASSPDHQTSGTFFRIMCTQRSNNQSKYYSYDGSVLADITNGTDSTNSDYDKGSTDMIVYKGETYITTKAKLCRFSSADTFDFGFATLGGEFYSPLLVFEDNLYYGDGHELKRMTSAGGTPATILTLPVGSVITALGIDRGTGKILVANIGTGILSGGNVSNTLSGRYYLNWYDGFSNKVSKVVEVDDQIFSLYSIGNTTYVGYGQNIGFINGSGVTFLRRLRNVDPDVDELPYRHNIANIGSTLYVVDGHTVLAYGEILPGRKVWWPVFEAPSNTTIQAIMHVGSNKLGISYKAAGGSPGVFSTIDVRDTSTIGTMNFISNKFNFTRPINIQSIYLEYITAIDNNSTTGRNLFIFLASEGYDTQNELTKEGEANLDNTSGSTIYEIYPVIGVPADKTWGFQLRYLQQSTNWGLRRILIYYDQLE